MPKYLADSVLSVLYRFRHSCSIDVRVLWGCAAASVLSKELGEWSFEIITRNYM